MGLPARAALTLVRVRGCTYRFPMDIILVPGLWLDAASWDAVVPALERAGHTVHSLTMPGVGVPAPASADIGIADWVDAVVTEIDRCGAPVALVGHSGGGNVVWGAADARPDRVQRVIFVDTAPPASGMPISEFELVDGVVPFPGWDFFDEPDVYDLDEQTRARTAGLTLSVPGKVPTDPLLLRNDARHQVPVTVLAGGLDAESFTAMLSEWPSSAAEFSAIADAHVVKLGTGHWPQFSKPTELAAAMVEALEG